MEKAVAKGNRWAALMRAFVAGLFGGAWSSLTKVEETRIRTVQPSFFAHPVCVPAHLSSGNLGAMTRQMGATTEGAI
jgi:hypothetical protein